jgi:DnaJ like chaperone protein
MSLWGKIAGGAAGLALGGPLGALMGVVAGHFLVDERQRTEGAKSPADGRIPPERQAAFIIGVIALSAKMAKADGEVTFKEISAFRDFVKVPPGEMKHVEFVFDQARKSVNGFESYAKQLARMFRNDREVLEDLLDGLFHIARADGVFHDGELAYLHEVGRIFGFDEMAFERIKARNMPGSLADPYTVLGVDPKASDDEVKAVYRRLVREHHPDAMVARGVPEEFIVLANDKLAAINGAYEKIEQARGLRGGA